MDKRLMIYLTPNRASVSVQNGVDRETAGKTMPEVLQAMHHEDLSVLLAFCQATLETAGKAIANV